ncbi:hypothetical protein INT45_004887 [Circinella minor]|uniref:Homing endonuclease LAGLIDADG domain-containing protein n=2 Tax=Mucorales TaxID=4827 RepID=A0A8H7VHV9_9FUNG|nr:hypothetical protein INT46_000196 [Mucor plumbeus]KAG2217058.1 hypothetical protein INT45_004887 [Circinella minor]
MKSILNKFSPSYLSGFTQADGNFHISFQKVEKLSLGLRVSPKFTLTQHIKDKPLLEEIKSELGVGFISTSRDAVNYSVSSVPQIKNKILPLFEQSPLRAGKLESYLIFKKVVEMMENKEHLTKEGLAKIINMSYFMNTASSRTNDNRQELLKRIGFEGISEIEKLTIPTLSPINLDFIRGLTDGDGSFFIGFHSNGRITASYTVIQESSCKNVLEELVNYFGCGKVYDLSSSKSSRYQVENLNDICNKIIPHFKDNMLLTEKKTHFDLFAKACELIQNGSHKSKEGLMEIINLTYNMNKDGKGRKLTKEEYINLIELKFKSSSPLNIVPKLEDNNYGEIVDYDSAREEILKELKTTLITDKIELSDKSKLESLIDFDFTDIINKP